MFWRRKKKLTNKEVINANPFLLCDEFKPIRYEATYKVRFRSAEGETLEILNTSKLIFRGWFTVSEEMILEKIYDILHDIGHSPFARPTLVENKTVYKVDEIYSVDLLGYEELEG